MIQTPSGDGASFADRLRALADLYDTHPGLPEPTGLVRLYVGDWQQPRTEQVAGFRLAQSLATTPVAIDDYYVGVELPVPGFSLRFEKSAVGEKRTVVREVEEYVFVPADAVTG